MLRFFVANYSVTHLKEEGRGKKEEGRRKREEGRRKTGRGKTGTRETQETGFFSDINGLKRIFG
ncbi:hypothetical protein QUB60_08590 [Microcoleus sp. A2-C5]|uniref:hypothetical protein n=1 Tax=unclassified Microcoleus TaxID=2642155 RepID=UPI002FD1935C